MLDFGHEVLSKEEEVKLFKRLESGDITAKEDIIKNNTRLVLSVAKGFGTSMSLEDRISYGCIGLITAMDKFDYRKGTKFSSYAVWWIRLSIQRAIQDYSQLIRIPAHVWQKGNKEKFDIQPYSLDFEYEKAEDHRDGMMLEQILGTEEDEYKEIENNLIIRQFAKILTDREKRVIALRYGFLDGTEHTTRDCGERIGCSRQTICNIEKRAIKKIREEFID